MTYQQTDKEQRIFVIHNPVAGTSDPDHVGDMLAERLRRKGVDFHIHQTSEHDNVRELVNHSLQQGYDGVWAAGGDGTVSGVANGLINRSVPLGIVPIGTGNALARELGIPLDPAQACDLLLGQNHIKLLDVLKVDAEYFVLSVSVGISSLTMTETARDEKRRLGRWAYIWHGTRLLLSKSRWPFQVVVDGQAGFIRSSELLVANTGIIGLRPIRWGSQIQPDDGVVNLCYAKIDTYSGFLALVTAILLGRQEEVDEIVCKPAQEFVEISSRRRMPVQGDGDFIGYTPVKIEVVPSALSVIVPVQND